jgi:hypothetical protein
MIVSDLVYLSYSVGSYGRGKYEGITLHFICEATGESYYVIFNVDRKYKRGKKKGKARPGKQFSVSKQSKFYKLWVHTCGLDEPPKGLTTFHDYMGRLKSFKFQAETIDDNQLFKDSLRLMSENCPITDGYPPDTCQKKYPDSDSAQPVDFIGCQPESYTCAKKYVLSKQVNTNEVRPVTALTETQRVQEQSVDEWWADYDASDVCN